MDAPTVMMMTQVGQSSFWFLCMRHGKLWFIQWTRLCPFRTCHEPLGLSRCLSVVAAPPASCLLRVQWKWIRDWCVVSLGVVCPHHNDGCHWQRVHQAVTITNNLTHSDLTTCIRIQHLPLNNTLPICFDKAGLETTTSECVQSRQKRACKTWFWRCHHFEWMKFA